MSTPKDESGSSVIEDTGLANETDVAGREADDAATGKQQRHAAGEGGASLARDAATNDLGLDGQQHSNFQAKPQPPTSRPEETAPETLQQQTKAHEPHEEGEEQDIEKAEGEDEQEGLPYPEPESSSPLLPPPDFKPFFTLIESSDADSNEHYHPTVHYVFADDDPEILTDAALESLNSQQQQEASVESERFVILDLSQDGKTVQSATSLSPDWQNVKTNISPAPSWGGGDGKGADRGLMLRISGQEARPGQKGKGKKKTQDVEGLLRAFDEQMSGLDGVLGDENTATAAIDTQGAPAHERVHEIDSV